MDAQDLTREISVCSLYTDCDKNTCPSYLEDVFTRSYVCNVDPLAVDIMAVRVPAANRDPLLPHVIAGITLMDACYKTVGNTVGDMRRHCTHPSVEEPLESIWKGEDEPSVYHIPSKQIRFFTASLAR